MADFNKKDSTIKGSKSASFSKTEGTIQSKENINPGGPVITYVNKFTKDAVLQGAKRGTTAVVRAFSNRANELEHKGANYNFRLTANPDTEVSKSIFGTPVYDNLVFGNPDNRDENVFIQVDGTEGTYRAVTINDVLLEVAQTRNIITTSVPGRNGTIKEYIADGDYMITATGHITNSDAPYNDNYPVEQVEDFLKVLTIQDAIKVTSGILTKLRVTSVVIKDYNISQERGIRNQQMFTLTMLSDREIELTDVES